MARSEIPMVINLRQNKNYERSAYCKYYAEVYSKEPLNLKGFAAHMTSHGKIADYQMCVLVLGQVVDCVTPGSGHFVTVTDSPDPTVAWNRGAKMTSSSQRRRFLFFVLCVVFFLLLLAVVEPVRNVWFFRSK